MTSGLILIPIISALIGWCLTSLAIKLLFWPKHPKKILGINFQGVIPKKQPQVASAMGKFAATEGPLLFHNISIKITSPQNIEKLMPFVEEHIDHFLRVKLAEKMPVISMFIGDKTIGELKGVFMEELKSLFPLLMQNYLINLQQDLNLEQIVTQKVATFSLDKLEDILNSILGKEFRFVKIIGAVLGFIIGLLQIVITLLHV